MSYVTKIITAFGGVRPMARALSSPVSTIHSWKARGTIPDDHKPTVLARARQLGLPLSEADFFPITPPLREVS